MLEYTAVVNRITAVFVAAIVAIGSRIFVRKP